VTVTVFRLKTILGQDISGNELKRKKRNVSQLFPLLLGFFLLRAVCETEGFESRWAHQFF
jgi:hypothetical protein